VVVVLGVGLSGLFVLVCNVTAAAHRLKISGKAQKVLQVPLKDMAKAREALRNAGIGGTVKNMSGSRVSRVPKPK